MKALEIFEQDIADREQGTPLPRQQYYTALRDALYRELMQQGYSDYLETMLLEIRGGMEVIYVLDYAALMECHSMIVLGRDMRDAAEYVPHLHLRGAKARWDALEGAGSLLMPVARDLPEKLRQLRAVSRQLVDARDDTVIPQADDAAQREIEQVHLLNKMLDERCRALQQERDELQARLRQMEEGVITEQVRYAIEARRIQEEEALRQTYAAQQEAAREAYRMQFGEEMSAARQRQEADAQQIAKLRETAAAEYAAIRKDLGDDLTRLTQLVSSQMAKWQNALDRSECRMLAQSYTSLYELYAKSMTELVLDAQCAGTDEALLAKLAEMQNQLRSRLNQLEQAMLRLGLTVIRPAEGEAFNSAYHMPADIPAATADALHIARCLCPGVMLHGAQEALVRAEVALAAQ